MNPFIQGETSGGQSVHPEKRKRGRPRKDKSLKEHRITFGSQEADGAQSMVGQPVAGYIESSFDAGFLLNLRIGNSPTNLRGVVFKPGNFAPITAENDVAPHLQMIGGEDLSFPPENRSVSRRPKLTTKHGSATPASASVRSVGGRGNVVPVVLQPVDLSSRVPVSSQMPPDASQTTPLLALGDKDVHMVEPLSIIPPNRAIPVDQRYIVSPPPTSHQVSLGSQNQNSSVHFSGGTSSFELPEKTTPTESTDTDDMTSLESSDAETENGIEEELNVSGEEDLGTDVKHEATNTDEIFPAEPSQAAFTTNSTTSFTVSPHNAPANPLFGFGTGRMTDLLQSVQENIKDKQVQIAEQQTPSTTKVEFNQFGASATHPNN